MKKLNKRTPGALMLALVSVAIVAPAESAHAAAVVLVNPSFELPDTFDGGRSVVVDGWGAAGGAPLRGLWDPDNAFYANSSGNTVPLPGTADGFQVGFVSDASALLSQLVGTLAPNTTYTLTVAFGNSLLGQPTGWIQLTDGGNVLAENRGFTGTSGTFVDRSVSFTTGASASGNLIIVLRAEANEAHYDNVRLDATLVPEPATALLLLPGLLALALRRPQKLISLLPLSAVHE